MISFTKNPENPQELYFFVKADDMMLKLMINY